MAGVILLGTKGTFNFKEMKGIAHIFLSCLYLCLQLHFPQSEWVFLKSHWGVGSQMVVSEAG